MYICNSHFLYAQLIFSLKYSPVFTRRYVYDTNFVPIQKCNPLCMKLSIMSACQHAIMDTTTKGNVKQNKNVFLATITKNE